MAGKSHYICIEDVTCGVFDTIIDVRSPSEFAKDHIPGAINCPVLDDAQREDIGTLYVQVSSFVARRKGAALVSRNIATHIEETFIEKEKDWKPLIYCWRGGQRSGSMCTVLRNVGWNAVLLKGGYKAYRKNVLKQLETIPQKFNYIVIGGPTGSGKTKLLKILEEQGAQILDLEGLAQHKGSVLGISPDIIVQSQKAFDTRILEKFLTLDPALPVFVEAESRKIGRVSLPKHLHEQMKKSSLAVIDVPIDQRVSFLLKDYDWFKENPDKLKKQLSFLKDIQGKKKIAQWHALIDQGEWSTLTHSLLAEHYDALYQRASHKSYSDDAKRYTFSVGSITKEAFEGFAEEIREKFVGGEGGD